MLDFAELSSDGEGLELLVRELCLALGYEARWAGRGADGDRDLIVIEPGDPMFGSKRRSWLVSCKHTAGAQAGKGRSVNAGDLDSDGGIADAVAHHQSNGFLLVCSTQPSSALVTRLEAVEASKAIPIHIWDGVQLERMLCSARGWAVAQRFMPVSAKATGWQVFATSSPNRFVVVTRGFFIQVTNRHGSTLPYQLTSLDDRLDAVARIQQRLPSGHELRMRAVFCDDKHGWFTWYIDYLYGKVRWDTPEVEEPGSRAVERIKGDLGDGTVTYDDGQIDNFEVTVRAVNRSADGYDPDHYSYYDELPGYV